MARGEIRPKAAIVTLPLAINVLKQQTSVDPLKGVLGVAAGEERDHDVLSADFVVGHPYVDGPDMGAAAIAIHRYSRQKAMVVARRIALAAWEERTAFQGDAVSVAAAVEQANGFRNGLLVLLDVGDNIGGGSPGDSATILEGLVKLKVPGVLATVCDPEAVSVLQAAGCGRSVSLELGGKAGMPGVRGLQVDAVVLRLADGRFEESGPTHGGFRVFDSGPVAVVQIQNGTVLVSSKPVMMISRAQFESAGIELSTFRIAIAKGVHSPRPLFSPYNPTFLAVDSPGCTAASFDRFTFRSRRRPMFPFEPDAVYA